MRMSRMWSMIMVVASLMFAYGFICVAQEAKTEKAPRKFKKVFAFTNIPDEEYAKKLQELNVYAATCAASQKEIALAKKYGIKPLVSFGPGGAGHRLGLTSEEAYLCAELNGRFLPKDLTREQKNIEIKKIRRKNQYCYGGEPYPGNKEVMFEGCMCFVGADARKVQKERLLKTIAKTKGAEGVMFDYVGYTNYYGCEDPMCQHLLKQYLKEKSLPDTQENRNAFFLQELVAYNNELIDAVKEVNPGLITATHIYPVFMPEPLYGNRLKFDYCGQTCAWYFLWPENKIRDYSKKVVSEQNRYFPGVKGVPFIGYTNEDWADRKTPEIVEKELNAILDSGTDTLMIHMVRDVIASPEIFAVFKKYCGKD